MISIPRLLPVQSSSIKAVGYKDNVLFVQFNSGSIYGYQDVPAEVFIKLINADSVGSYFAREIKTNYKII